MSSQEASSTTTRYSIFKGEQVPWHLLRLPQGVSLTSRPPYRLVEEDVIIEEDEGGRLNQQQGHQQSPQEKEASQSVKRRRRSRPMKQWVLSNPLLGQQTLRGSLSALDGTYMAMIMDPNGKSLHLVPLRNLLALRQGFGGPRTTDDALVQDFLRTGSKLKAQTDTWSSRYGAALVDMVEGIEREDGDAEKRRRGGGQEQWTRRFNPDDDENDYILPTSRVALNYNDLLDLGRDEDGEIGDVIDAVHQATDLGQDEIPDGAEDGYAGALEFGEETRKDYGGPVVERDEEAPRGLFPGEDEEDEYDSDLGVGWVSDEDEASKKDHRGFGGGERRASSVASAARRPQLKLLGHGGAARSGGVEESKKGKAAACDGGSSDSDFSQVEEDEDDDDDGDDEEGEF